jgi:hypothetical protein
MNMKQIIIIISGFIALGLGIIGVMKTPTVALAACNPASHWIHLSYPNGGQTLRIGTSMTVTWVSCNIPATTTMYMGFYKNRTTAPLVAGTTGLNTGSKTFDVPSIPVGTYFYNVHTMSGDTIQYIGWSGSTFVISN